MKDKRIWIVIACILVAGTGVTHYTKYYVNSQGAAMTAESTAGAVWAGETAAADSLAAASDQYDTKADVSQAAAAAESPESATPSERGGYGAPGPGAGALQAGPAAAPAAAEAFSSDQAASPGDEALGDGMDADAAASPEVLDNEAAAPETAMAENVPLSPLTGAKTREYKTNLTVDYRKRLEDLDTQIYKMREEETDSNVYSIKTSAETELKMWESELNSIYNALMEMLSPEDAAKLAAEQQEWLKSRDVKAAEGSGRNSGSIEGIGYAATLTGLTRDRAYELVGRYEEANGILPDEELPTLTAP